MVPLLPLDPDEEEEQPVSLCDKVSLYKGDITILEVDAIVNAGKHFGFLFFNAKPAEYELASLLVLQFRPSDAPVCCVWLPPSVCMPLLTLTKSTRGQFVLSGCCLNKRCYIFGKNYILASEWTVMSLRERCDAGVWKLKRIESV